MLLHNNAWRSAADGQQSSEQSTTEFLNIDDSREYQFSLSDKQNSEEQQDVTICSRVQAIDTELAIFHSK